MLDRCMHWAGMRTATSSITSRRMKRPRWLITATAPPAGSSAAGAQRQSVPVAIVGAGPAGLTLSGLLSQFGVPSILVEKLPALSTHPQAHFINLRSMEILQHAFAGLDAAVLERCPPRDEWRDFVVCSTVLGRQLARVDNFSGGEAERRRLSPTSVAHLSQNVLLPLLLQEAQRAAAERSPSSQILFDTEATGFRRIRDSSRRELPPLELLVRRGQSRTALATDAITCDYVVAADGAGSSMRSAAGLGLSGRRDLGHVVNIHFRCKGLGRLLRAKGQRPGMLYFVYNEETICVLVAHNVKKGEWACQVPFFPPHQTAESFSSERSMSLVRHALGPAGSALDIDICSIRPWTMNALVADKYYEGDSAEGGSGGVGGAGQMERRGHGGGVLLLGDAAHQFPPAGGFGLNTGVQDAHNLAWKLAAVHHGLASPDLLLTYDHERRPIAMRNAALSVQNFKRSLRVTRTLGVDPDLGASATVMDKLVRSPLALNWGGGINGLAASLWQSEKRAEKIFGLGRRQLKSLGEEGNPYGDARVRSLRRLLAEGGGLPLLFPEHDVGFAYGKGAVLPDKNRRPASPSAREMSPRGLVSSVRRECGHGAFASAARSIRLGGRMPHFVLRSLPLDAASRSRGEGGERDVVESTRSLSTVDLPDQIRGLLLARFRSHISDLGSINVAKAVDGNKTIGLTPFRDAMELNRASLAAVLIVVSSDAKACDSSDDGFHGKDSTAAAAAATASARWRNAALSVQCRALQDTTPTAQQRTVRTTLCPLVVLTVSPPTDKATTDDVRLGCAGNKAGAVTGSGKSTALGDNLRRAAAVSAEAEGPWRLETMSCMGHLEPYLHGNGPAPRKWSTGAQHSVRVEDSPDCGEDGSTPGFGQGEGTGWTGSVLSMRAVDDSSRSIGKAFAAARAEAVLLRPDGHIAWVAARPANGLDVGKEHDAIGDLGLALDTVYAGRGRG